MNAKQIYEVLLRLYPADYRTQFAAEMLRTFDEAAQERSGQKSLSRAHFIFVELTGLLMGAAREWVAKLISDSPAGGLHWPDPRMMHPRPTRQRIRFDGTCPVLVEGYAVNELEQTERRIAFAISQMVHAIANHNFPKARFYSNEEREQREHLRLLRESDIRGESLNITPFCE